MIILILVSLAAAAQTPEPRWVEVRRTPDSAIHVDSATIRAAGKDALEAWTRKTYQTPRHYRDADTYDAVVSHLRINCVTLRLLHLETTYYLGTTLVRRSRSSAASRRWSPRVPGSDWDAVITATCRMSRDD
ncbi:MAG TPA: surface-adhesin E family protein [Gemmatimonadales bacterium]|nr:surface-adhesin E family protein [Gemmatimonadales bacterium]